MMELLQERNREGTGAACPSMPKSDLERKMTVIAGHEAFSSNSGKKGAASPLERGAGNQELFKDVVRSCRKKSIEMEVQ